MRKEKKEEVMKVSLSVNVENYERIMIFNNEKDFKEAVKNNDCLVPLVGERPSDREQFPLVFIAGWK